MTTTALASDHDLGFWGPESGGSDLVLSRATLTRYLVQKNGHAKSLPITRLSSADEHFWEQRVGGSNPSAPTIPSTSFPLCFTTSSAESGGAQTPVIITVIRFGPPRTGRVEQAATCQTGMMSSRTIFFNKLRRA